MPLKTYDTKQSFDVDYDNYNRATWFSEAQLRADKFVELLDLHIGQQILILGCGFGWTVEGLHERGYTHTIGVDTSPYILTTIPDGVPVFSNMGQFVPDVIITEHMLEMYEDSELPEVLQDYSAPVFAHLIVAKHNDPDSKFNLKTLADWKELLPQHIIIEDGTWRTM